MVERASESRRVWYDLDPFVWYDLDPLGRELWVVEGPPGYRIEDLDPGELPAGFRWVEPEEWRSRRSEVTIVSAELERST